MRNEIKYTSMFNYSLQVYFQLISEMFSKTPGLPPPPPNVLKCLSTFCMEPDICIGLFNAHDHLYRTKDKLKTIGLS